MLGGLRAAQCSSAISLSDLAFITQRIEETRQSQHPSLAQPLAFVIAVIFHITEFAQQAMGTQSAAPPHPANSLLSLPTIAAEAAAHPAMQAVRIVGHDLISRFNTLPELRRERIGRPQQRLFDQFDPFAGLWAGVISIEQPQGFLWIIRNPA